MADEIQGSGRLQIATDMANNAYVVAKTALSTISDLAMNYCFQFKDELSEKTSNQPTLLGTVFKGAISLPSVAYSAGVLTYQDSQKESDYINEVEEQQLLDQSKELDLGGIQGLKDIINDKTSTTAEKQNALAALKGLIHAKHVETQKKEELKSQLEECKEYLQQNPEIDKRIQEKNSYLHGILQGTITSSSSSLIGKAIQLVKDMRTEANATHAEEMEKQPFHLRREIINLTDVINKHDINLSAAQSRIFMNVNSEIAKENSVEKLQKVKVLTEDTVFESLCEKIKQNPKAQSRLASQSEETRSIFENGRSPDPSKTKFYIEMAEVLLQDKIEVEDDNDEDYETLLNEFENFSAEEPKSIDSPEIKPVVTSIESNKERRQQRLAKVEEIKQKSLELEQQNVERRNTLAAIIKRKETGDLG